MERKVSRAEVDGGMMVLTVANRKVLYLFKINVRCEYNVLNTDLETPPDSVSVERVQSEQGLPAINKSSYRALRSPRSVPEDQYRHPQKSEEYKLNHH